MDDIHDNRHFTPKNALFMRRFTNRIFVRDVEKARRQPFGKVGRKIQSFWMMAEKWHFGQ